MLIACQMGAMFCIPQRTCLGCKKYRITSLQCKDQLLRHWACSNCRTSVSISKKKIAMAAELCGKLIVGKSTCICKLVTRMDRTLKIPVEIGLVNTKWII